MINTVGSLATQWLTFRQPHTGDRCWGKTALLTRCSSLSYSVTRKWVGVQFLKDVGLLRSQVTRDVCSCRMSSYVDSNRKDGFRLRCPMCQTINSNSHCSCSRQDNPTLTDVMILLTDILGYVSAHIIQQQHKFGAPTNPDWGQSCIQAMLISRAVMK